jgi:hypothetical protein
MPVANGRRRGTGGPEPRGRWSASLTRLRLPEASSRDGGFVRLELSEGQVRIAYAIAAS